MNMITAKKKKKQKNRIRKFSEEDRAHTRKFKFTSSYSHGTDKSNSFQHLNYTTIQRRNKASKQQNIEPTSVISIAYILFRFNIET